LTPLVIYIQQLINNIEMSNNLSESQISDRSRYTQLLKQSKQIVSDLHDLHQDPIFRSGIPNVNLTKIECSFEKQIKSWKSLRSTIFTNISSFSTQLMNIRKKNQQFRISSEKKLNKNRRSIEIEEKKIKLNQRLAGKSLTKISKVWRSDLKNMKKMISTQIVSRYRIEESIEEFDSKLSCQSLLSSASLNKWDEDEGPSLDKILINDASEMVNYSAEFSIEMRKIDKNKKKNKFLEGSEVSRSGWKSEFDSENDHEHERESFGSVSPLDVRSAIQVLKKANLLNPGNQEVLNQITSLLRDPENSNNLELFLQLLRLRKDKHDKSCSSHKSSKDIMENDLKESKNYSHSGSSLIQERRNFALNSMNEEKINFPDSIGLSFYEHDMKFASGVVEEKPTRDNIPLEQATLIDNFYENRHKIPVKKSTLDYQSTGVSSQTGLRSRVTLKTVGSESSQRVLTHSDKTIEEDYEEI